QRLQTALRQQNTRQSPEHGNGRERLAQALPCQRVGSNGQAAIDQSPRRFCNAQETRESRMQTSRHSHAVPELVGGYSKVTEYMKAIRCGALGGDPVTSLLRV